MNHALGVRLALLASVYVWEASVVLIILSLYRTADKHDVLSFLSHLDGKLFLMASLFLVCASLFVSRKYHALREIGSRPLESIMKWNIVPVILVIAIAEGTLRLLSTDTQWGTVLGGTLLGPHRFEGAVMRHSQQVSERIYYDQLLGWTVRPNLSSRDGMYFTSPQGTRSPRPGVAFAESRAACRIALVGDSHTFGSELKFEDTWSYHLERHLPSGCQVLNFGVPGYSVGQMYLRYLRDVRPWHPHVVVLALSSNSAGRTMGVYGLNMFPRSTPWAQPRFQIKDQGLVPINVPLPVPEELASARSMSDLPFIDYDWFFVPGRWDLPQWRYLYHSYLFRVYTTWFPIWRNERRGDSEQSINHELLRSFIRITNSEGTTPIVIYLPDKTDYQEPARKESVSLWILRTSGIKYLDLLPCLDAVAPNDRFIRHGDHYSPPGSIAIARCLRPVVVKKLSVPST